MKVAVALLVALVSASPLNAIQFPATGSGALARELQPFLDLIPVEKILEISKAYLAQDREFQIAVELLKSNESKQWVQEVEQETEFKHLLNYVQNNGLDIKFLVNRFNKALGIPSLVSRIKTFFAPHIMITGGIEGYVQDIGSLISMDKFEPLYEEKIANSRVFKNFVHEVTTVEYISFYVSIFSNRHYQNLEQQAGDHGINRNYFQVSAPLILVMSTVI